MSNVQQEEEKRVETKKIQFEFTTEALKRLEKLERETEATSKAEVVRRALRLYEWVVTQLEPGDWLLVKDEQGDEIYKTKVSMLR